MARTRRSHSTANAAPPRERDRGLTFIEMLVAIVLLGTVVIAVVAALQVATTAAVTDANHSRAYILLHEASDAVFTAERASCASNTESQIIALYEAEFAGLTSPEGWSTVTPDITRIEFLNASEVDGRTVYAWGSTCQEGLTDSSGNPTPLKSQKVTIEVIAPDGSMAKSIETVKR